MYVCNTTQAKLRNQTDLVSQDLPQLGYTYDYDDVCKLSVIIISVN